MKKFLVICVAALMCLSFCGTVLAAGYAVAGNAVEPRGIISLSSGMPKVTGTANKYNPWAGASAGMPEQITVGFTLYKVVNGREEYVTSNSNSGHSSYVEAESYVNLSSGTYKLYAYYTGETKSDDKVTTYKI